EKRQALDSSCSPERCTRFAGSLPGRGAEHADRRRNGDEREGGRKDGRHGKPARGRNHITSKGPAKKLERRLLKDRDNERETEQDGADGQEARSFRFTREALPRSDQNRQEVVTQSERYSGHRCDLERRNPRGDASMGKAQHPE